MANKKIFRARWHDYRARCIYMITLCKHPGAPVFGHPEKLPSGQYRITLTSLGAKVRDNIFHLSDLEPAIRVLQYAVMPDHAHILVFVQQPLNEHLGFTIARLKININKAWGKDSIFEEGFNDQILKPGRSLDTIYNYIRDNPRRLGVRLANPDFFRRSIRVNIEGVACSAYGNPHLLQVPFKDQVVVHRADSPEVLESKRERWLHTAANRGVIVSPFISPAEKAIRSEAEELGSRIILLTNKPLVDREKPASHDFELCCQGRLLIVAPEQEMPPCRATFMRLNRLAEAIAEA